MLYLFPPHFWLPLLRAALLPLLALACALSILSVEVEVSELVEMGTALIALYGMVRGRG